VIFCSCSHLCPQEVHSYSYVMRLPFRCLLVYTWRMPIKALILLALLSRTPHHKDVETWQAREDRLTLTADAIAEASLRATCQLDDSECTRLWPASAKALALLLVTQAQHETHLSAEVHHNRCRLSRGECDSRRVLQEGEVVFVQQSFGLWQLKNFSDIPPEDWDAITSGVPGTRQAAWHAARRLSSAYRACGTLTGAISRYAVGSGCSWEGASERVDTWVRLDSLSPEHLQDRVDQFRALRASAVEAKET
jgi:hypothetical protein